MPARYYIIACVLIFLFILFQQIKSSRDAREKLKRTIKESWGTRPTKEYSFEEFENIQTYYRQTSDNTFSIDDITWNDLDMDTIFMLINNTNSSIGQEYLYNLLRKPCFDESELQKRNKLIVFFQKHTDHTFSLKESFAKLGYAKKISFFEYVARLHELKDANPLVHYLAIVFLVISIITTIFNPPVGIIMLIATFMYNIITYYRKKAEVENFFVCVKYIVAMVLLSENIIKLDIPELSEYNKKLQNLASEMKSVCRGSSLIEGSNLSGSLGDVFLDYVRMITHIDLIKFHNILNFVKKNIDVVTELYQTLGFLEAMTAIASFRALYPDHCIPIFLASDKNQYTFENLYHPMIDEPVKNSITENGCVLLTGSNASGKSTFLKTVAINAILAQTIDTCTADIVKIPMVHVYSSMALRDDLTSQESYFIVEIKSLKRILDHVNAGEKVLCFIDEVLRGTNTVERIAASSQILKELSTRHAICFAATHDVELTHILEKYYHNYHFQEQVTNQEVVFDYQLRTGKATSRNAIRLLAMMGYNTSVVTQAEAAANEFLQKGSWDQI